MKYTKYNIVFAVLALLILTCYYLSYLFSNLIFIYISIFLGVVLVLLNFFVLRRVSLKNGVKIYGLEFHNLDKLILGILALLYLFILDTGVPNTNLFLLTYALFTLGLLTSLRIVKTK